MEIVELMTRNHEGQAVARLGSHFELSPRDIGLIIGYVVPLLEDALTRLTAHPEGLAAILAQLASGQSERDLCAADIFENSRILANGTGLLSLLLRNEATIHVISCIAAQGAKIDVRIIRRMMPFIATIYISALARRSREPLRELARRFTDAPAENGRSPYRLAELVLAKSPARQAVPKQNISRRGSIRDILNTLTQGETDEKTDFCI